MDERGAKDRIGLSPSLSLRPSVGAARGYGCANDRDCVGRVMGVFERADTRKGAEEEPKESNHSIDQRGIETE